MSTQGLPADGLSTPPIATEPPIAADEPTLVTLPTVVPQRWSRRDTAIMLGAIVVAFLFYLIRLDQPGRYIYDEVYHAYTAARLAEGNRDPYNPFAKVPEADKEKYKVAYVWDHPALAKLPMEAGILAFGDNPFGWRIASAVFGSIGIGIMYALGRTMFDRFVGLIGTVLLLFDGMWFVQSRTSMNDIFVVCFLLLSYLAFFLYLRSAPERRWRYVWLTGIALGLAVSTKWTAFYSIGWIGLIMLGRETWLYLRRCNVAPRVAMVIMLGTLALLAGGVASIIVVRAAGLPLTPYLIGIASAVAVVLLLWLLLARGSDLPGRAAAMMLGSVGVLVGALVIVPAVLYVAGYVQYFAMGYTIADWRELQYQMWWYHTNLRACHDWASPWWTWPLMIKPVWYHVENLPDGRVAQVFTMGNPAIWWAWLAALGVVAWQWGRNQFRMIGLGVVLLGYFGQIAPWVISPRVSYIYHMLPSVPFGVLAIAYVLGLMREQRRVVFGYLVLVVLVFAFFYSHYTALPVSKEYTAAHYWLPTWQPGTAWAYKCPPTQQTSVLQTIVGWFR